MKVPPTRGVPALAPLAWAVADAVDALELDDPAELALLLLDDELDEAEELPQAANSTVIDITAPPPATERRNRRRVNVRGLPPGTGVSPKLT